MRQSFRHEMEEPTELERVLWLHGQTTSRATPRHTTPSRVAPLSASSHGRKCHTNCDGPLLKNADIDGGHR